MTTEERLAALEADVSVLRNEVENLRDANAPEYFQGWWEWADLPKDGVRAVWLRGHSHRGQGLVFYAPDSNPVMDVKDDAGQNIYPQNHQYNFRVRRAVGQTHLGFPVVELLSVESL